MVFVFRGYLSRVKPTSLREFPKKHFRTAVDLSMDMRYEFEAGYTFEASLASCHKVIATWLR